MMHERLMLPNREELISRFKELSLDGLVTHTTIIEELESTERYHGEVIFEIEISFHEYSLLSNVESISSDMRFPLLLTIFRDYPTMVRFLKKNCTL